MENADFEMMLNGKNCYSDAGCGVFMLEEPRIKNIPEKSVERYVDLLSDVGFKLVFGMEANKDIMIELLNHIIHDRKIADIEYLDKEKHGISEVDKDCVFDLYCVTDDGSRIIVEVQKRMHDHYVERTLYYSTFPIREQMSFGDKEYQLCPIYIISILKTRLHGVELGNQIRSSFRIYEDSTHVLLTPLYNIIFLEMGKFRKTLEELDGSILDGFYYCIKNMQKLSERPAELQHDIFRRLFETCRISKMDKTEQYKYKKAMMTERDIWCYKEMARKHGFASGEKQGIKHGMKKGLKKGLEQGLQQGMQRGMGRGMELGEEKARGDIARKMKDRGFAVSEICAITGLAEAAVAGL
ncbi:MAG: Rpn family recombination-promoting nuclease/putative transposase [Clostridium sp.]|nr:Rpn family recombination-promoting nuclease/putative transposase [Bacteroides sp.]MCM1198320.1 Rpn family recombination-promoting nuclease/putative transposase [Clostridium sp.]